MNQRHHLEVALGEEDSTLAEVVMEPEEVLEVVEVVEVEEVAEAALGAHFLMNLLWFQVEHKLLVRLLVVPFLVVRLGDFKDV